MTGEIERRDVWFDSGGDRCAAWIYEPREPTFDGACVVMANGASLTRHDGLPAFAERFARGGVATLVFDHRCLGDSGGLPRQRIRFARQQEDWRGAIAHVRSLPGCDPDRVVLWGFSLSGVHVVQTAAADDRLAASMVLCPAIGTHQRVASTSPRVLIWLAPRAIANVLGCHLVVPVTGEPGTMAAMTLPGEAAGFAAVIPPDSPWRNELSPAVFIDAIRCRPVARASRVRCPLWVGLGELDGSVDQGVVRELARRAPAGELHEYPYDHFDAFLGSEPDRVATDQLAFLARALGGSRALTIKEVF